MIEKSTSEITRSRFQSQRKKLLIISIFFIIYIILDLKLKQIRILGNSFTVGNYNYIEFILESIVAYYFITFTQYFSIVDKSEMKSFYYNFRDKRLKLHKKSDIFIQHNINIDLQDIDIINVYPQNVVFRVHNNELSANPMYNEPTEFEINDNRISTSKIYAISKLCLTTPYFIEYFLPFSIIPIIMFVVIFF